MLKLSTMDSSMAIWWLIRIINPGGGPNLGHGGLSPVQFGVLEEF